VNPIFYAEGRDIIPSFTGPFKNLRDLFDCLIQKEKSYFENHDVQKIIIENFKKLRPDIENQIPKVLKHLTLLQYKLSKDNPFESMELPFILLHGDFDAHNIPR
jgi:hypothetical protein